MLCKAQWKKARYQDQLDTVFEVVAVETSGVIGHEMITVLGEVSRRVCVAISDLMSTPTFSRGWWWPCSGAARQQCWGYTARGHGSVD